MACELECPVFADEASTRTERLPEVDNCSVFWLVQHLQVISSEICHRSACFSVCDSEGVHGVQGGRPRCKCQLPYTWGVHCSAVCLRVGLPSSCFSAISY